MSVPLSAVPRTKRRQLAATFGVFAVLFAAVGAVALAGSGGAAVAAFAGLAFLLALLLALACGGIVHGLRSEAREEEAARVDASIDAAITEALAAQGYDSLCSCGHEHDPTELHITDAEPCAHDGSGSGCAQDCDACALAALRPSPPASAPPQ
jgi:hypothetical protein